MKLSDVMISGVHFPNVFLRCKVWYGVETLLGRVALTGVTFLGGGYGFFFSFHFTARRVLKHDQSSDTGTHETDQSSYNVQIKNSLWSEEPVLILTWYIDVYVSTPSLCTPSVLVPLTHVPF